STVIDVAAETWREAVARRDSRDVTRGERAADRSAGIQRSAPSVFASRGSRGIADEWRGLLADHPRRRPADDMPERVELGIDPWERQSESTAREPHEAGKVRILRTTVQQPVEDAAGELTHRPRAGYTTRKLVELPGLGARRRAHPVAECAAG